MTDRTTINVDKETHSEASQVKDEHGETWPEVLQWYAENRDGDTDTNDTEPMQVVPVEEVVGREVPQSSVDLSDVHTKLDRIDGALGDTVEKALEIGDSRNAVQLEATEYSKIADELEGRLR